MEVLDSPLAAAIRAWSCSASVGGLGQGPVPMATSGPPAALWERKGGEREINHQQPAAILKKGAVMPVVNSGLLRRRLVLYDVKLWDLLRACNWQDRAGCVRHTRVCLPGNNTHSHMHIVVYT